MDTVNTGIPVNERVSVNVLVEHNNIDFNSMYRLYSMLLIVKSSSIYASLNILLIRTSMSEKREALDGHHASIRRIVVTLELASDH